MTAELLLPAVPPQVSLTDTAEQTCFFLPFFLLCFSFRKRDATVGGDRYRWPFDPIPMGARSPAHISPTRARHGHDSRAVPGPQSRPMDASRHGPKKGGPIGPMGSTIGSFKYYVIHYQTLFKYFRAAGLPGQTGRSGPIKSISGRAWAGTSVHGQARHGPIIFSCLSGS